MTLQMRPVPELRTERLWLRAWSTADEEPFARLNADARVMKYMPALLSRAQSDAQVGRMVAHFEQHGFGLWPVEVPGIATFIGFVGLAVPRFTAPFTPCVEVGWRLAAEHWGQGYATEAGRAALAFGFEQLGLNEIVSFTSSVNRRSRAVMERLNMARDAANDFEHPGLPVGHLLRRHVLYRVRARQALPG